MQFSGDTKNAFFTVVVAPKFYEGFIDSLSALSYFSSREFACDDLDNLWIHIDADLFLYPLARKTLILDVI